MTPMSKVQNISEKSTGSQEKNFASALLSHWELRFQVKSFSLWVYAKLFPISSSSYVAPVYFFNDQKSNCLHTHVGTSRRPYVNGSWKPHNPL